MEIMRSHKYSFFPALTFLFLSERDVRVHKTASNAIGGKR